jgi:hypothetical protein
VRSSLDSAAPNREPTESPGDLFLSYNSKDFAAVQDVQTLLQGRGLSVFLDRESLTVGLNWFDALQRAIGQVRAVAVFLGPNGLGRWQRRELALALDRQTGEESEGSSLPVIPILLPGVLKPEKEFSGFLLLNTFVDLRRGLDNPGAFDRIEQAVRGTTTFAEPGPRPQAAALCPYRALESFREQDAPLFFGRDRFVINPERPEEGLLHKVRTCPLVAVVGASGSGKSSVVQAGLLPRLRREPPSRDTWDAVVFHPARRPFLRLAMALEAVRNPDATDATRETDAAKLSRSWAGGDLPLDFSLDQARKALEVNRLLLIVDQFEELFTTEVPDAVRRDFVTKLLAAADPARVTVLLTLRADFYGRAIELDPGLSDLMQRGIINVRAMSREERREAIGRPARLVSLSFEQGLVERILDDVGDEPGNLPLLEFALTELWERRDGGRLTHAAYEALGRVAGAIGRRAETVFATLSPDQRSAAPRLFGRLVRISAAGEQGADTRQRVRLRALDPDARSAVEPFVAGRLLVAGRDESLNDLAPAAADPAPRPADDLITVEVAHEALIRTWDRLKTWIDEDRAFLLWRQRLNLLITEWERSGRDAGALLRGAPLNEALRFARVRRDGLNDCERGFLAHSGKPRTVRHQIEKVKKKASRILNQAKPETVCRWFAVLALATDAKASSDGIVTIEGQYGRFPKAPARAGRLDEAKEAALAIVDPFRRSQALASVAEARARAGLADQAKEAALEAREAALAIEDSYLRFETMASAAEALARASVAEALARGGLAYQAALGIRDSERRPAAMASLAAALARAGRLDEAEEAALEAKAAALGIERSDRRIKALASVAEALARAGLADHAKAAAHGIEVSHLRSQALASVAEALARAGLADRAYEIVDQIDEGEHRSRVIAAVARAKAKADEFRQARRIAESCDLPDDRLDTFTTILSEYTKRKKPELAQVLGELENAGSGPDGQSEEP